MQDDFNQLRLLTKKLVHTPFQEGWQFRLDIHYDNLPKDLDIYVKDVVVEYSEYIQKSLRPKKVPVSQGAAFKAEDAPELPCMKGYETG